MATVVPGEVRVEAGTLISTNPTTGRLVGRFDVATADDAREVVARARGGRLVGGPRVPAAGRAAPALAGGPRATAGGGRRAGSRGGWQATCRGDRRDGRRHRSHRVGGHEREAGAGAAEGSAAPADRARGPPGVPAARHGGRDRPLELPGADPGRLARLRAGGGQRDRLQAQPVHPGGRSVAGGLVPPGRPRTAGPSGAARKRRGGCAAVPGRGGQDRLHRFDRHRKACDGGLCRDADPGPDRGGRQGRALGGRGRRPPDGGRSVLLGGETNAGETCLGIERAYASIPLRRVPDRADRPRPDVACGGGR